MVETSGETTTESIETTKGSHVSTEIEEMPTNQEKTIGVNQHPGITIGDQITEEMVTVTTTETTGRVTGVAIESTEITEITEELSGLVMLIEDQVLVEEVGAAVVVDRKSVV